MTITEALAELKTIEKRISGKQEYVYTYMFRLDSLKDPFEKDGGSAKLVAQEMQAISDLEERAVSLRLAIQKANEETTVSINGHEKSIADWLVWRREIAPSRERFLYQIRTRITQSRQAVQRGYGQTLNQTEKPSDIIVNVDEAAVSKELEMIKDILGQLDGQLSLKNATVMVSV